LIRGEEAAALRDLIAALPVLYREVFVLREIEQLSYREIAAAIGAPTGTVMSRLARARGLIAAAWRGREAGDGA
jgi:RNA polymerase sigma factor (sigma-70 family)